MRILKQLSAWLYQVSSGWVAFASIIIFLLFTGLVLPAQAKDANEISQAAGSPDMSFTYTPGELYEMAESYGVQGRAAYIQARFTFDLIWPLVYTLFLGTTISWTFKRTVISKSLLVWLNLAPLMGMALDYAENIATSIVMYRYPIPTDILATLAPIFTTTKWIFVAGSFGLLLIGILTVIWHSFRKHSGEKS
jgi:hypothetical protein